jgi:hypothetical protein
MAAGLGFKTFVTGEVLTAADTNGYLMQGTNVFASAAARTSAITSPQEGQMSYLKDTDSTEYYTGSAWVAVGAPSMTLLSTTAMSGTTTTVSGISSAYTSLYIFCPSITFSASAALRYKFNGSSYYYCEMATYSDAVLRVTSGQTTVAPQSGLSATNWGMTISVPSYTSTANKSSNANILNGNGAASFIEVFDTNAAAVSSFSITSAAGTATLSGNIFVYGVK